MTIQSKRMGLLLLMALLSLVVLLMAYPRLSSSLSYIPVEAALARHWEDYPIKQSQYPVLINAAKSSIRTLDTARYWQGLGWLHYLRAMDLDPATPEGFKSLSRAQLAFETFLKKSPARPAEWLRLAWVYQFLGHESERIVKTLKLSIYTGRAEQYLIVDRLSLSLQYADHFQNDGLALVRDQIQLAWRFNQARLLKLMRDGTFDQQVLLGLIADTNPELTQEIAAQL